MLMQAGAPALALLPGSLQVSLTIEVTRPHLGTPLLFQAHLRSSKHLMMLLRHQMPQRPNPAPHDVHSAPTTTLTTHVAAPTSATVVEEAMARP